MVEAGKVTVSQLQLEDAAALWAITAVRGLPDRVALGVICCALTEASLLDILHGDTNPDGTPTTSLGFFQQTSGYGTAQARIDPAMAVTMFLDGGPQGQRAFLQQPYAAGTLNDLARCIQAVQQSQFDGKTIDPSTGKPYPLAQNYIDNMPTALETLKLIKSSMFAPIRHQLMIDNTALIAAGKASTAINLWTQVTI